MPVYLVHVCDLNGSVGTGTPGSSLRLEWKPLPLVSVGKLSWLLTGSVCLCLCACFTFGRAMYDRTRCQGPFTATLPVEEGAPALVKQHWEVDPNPTACPCLEKHSKAVSSGLQGSLADFALCSPVCGRWV